MGRKNRRKRDEYTRPLRINTSRGLNTSRRVPHSHHSNHDRKTPQRGEIWFAELGYQLGTSIQGGCRPVIVISNDIGNLHAETVNVLPMTRHLKKPDLPCHTVLNPTVISDTRQMLDPSMVLAEQVTTIDKSQLRNYVGRVEDCSLLNSINNSLASQLALLEIAMSLPESTLSE